MEVYYQEWGIELYFAKIKGPVKDVMRASKFFEDLGEEHFTYRVYEAVMKACLKCFGSDDLDTLEEAQSNKP